MRFVWTPSSQTGGCELTAHPEDYDGCPAPSALRVDFTPRFSSPGRCAAAGVLAFGPFVSGSITFPQAISPELSHAVSAFLGPRAVWPGPLDLRPKAIPRADGTFVLGSPVDALPVQDQRQDDRTTRLVLPSSGAEFGHTFGPGLVVLPTNAHLLTPDSTSPLRRLFPFLAAVVLVAEDIGVGTIMLPAQVQRDEIFVAAAELLRSVGIRIAVPDAA